MSTYTYLAQQFVTRKANLIEKQHFVVIHFWLSNCSKFGVTYEQKALW